MHVDGVTTLDGYKAYIFYDDRRRFAVPASSIYDRKSLLSALSQRGVVLRNKHAVDMLLDAVSREREFPEAKLTVRPGWADTSFALSSGEVINVPNTAAAEYLGSKVSSSPRGSLKNWRRRYAALIDAQPLWGCIQLMTFAGPLLRFVPDIDVAFELVGPTGAGKTTVIEAALAAIGEPASLQHGLVAAMGDVLAGRAPLDLCRDGLLVMDNADIGLPNGKSNKSTPALLELVRGSGASDRRLVLFVGDRSLVDCVGGEGRDAMRSRLVTIRCPDQGFGTLHSVPDGFSSASQAARALLAAALVNCGRPYARFLKRLVAAAAADPGRLQADIDAAVERFVLLANADPNNGEEQRLARAYGLLCAAGKLAEGWKVLPQRWGYQHVVLSMYRAERLPSPTIKSFKRRLRAIARAPETVDLAADPQPCKSTLRGAKAIVSDRAGKRKLLIRTKHIEDFFPDWDELRGRQEVIALQQRQKGRADTQLRINGPAERVYAFRLPRSRPREGREGRE